MAENKFEQLDQDDRLLYGPRGVLASGFPAAAQPKFRALLSMIGLATVPVIWVNREMAERSLSDLLDQPDDTGVGTDSDLSRALVVGGIFQHDLHQLMAAARQSGMQNAIWATVTPTSENWPFARLLQALISEREALNAQSESSSNGS